MNLPAFPDIQSAAERLQGVANRTPVLTSRTLDDIVGANVLLKCENMQRIGAFKFRGAYNAISRLSDEEKQRGVITHSSGNHAQAVALVGKLLGVHTVIVMPNNAPAIKRAATEGYGAEIVEYDPEATTREELSAEIRKERDLVLIPPYDHPHIIAGQGTAAYELLTDHPHLDFLFVPCGGGGLLSGSAISAKALAPLSYVVGVEPELADDATKSFRTEILHTVKNPPTIADGTRTPSLGKLTFPLVLKHVDDMQTVTEDEIKEAVRFLFYRMKLVVEPSGALGVALLLSGKIRTHGQVGIIPSGGNIDAATMNLILNHE
ncbi:threo-3-hydroxy-L-aspartate ammonia-lyase [bacterium]|nr:threo-3-hydroxy-L-aspartate ammonia-lyase [bacterium]